MASGEACITMSSAECYLLALPWEIRARIYCQYFRNPVLSIWNQRHATTLGHLTEIGFQGPRELAYRRAVADDYDEDHYERKSETKLFPSETFQTVGWLEDYSSLFLTCRQVNHEARDALGPSLHLKILYCNEMPCDAPKSLKRLYYGQIRHLTVMMEPIWKWDDEWFVRVNSYNQPATMPNLECVRIVLAESQPVPIVIDPPNTAEECVDHFLGPHDKLFLDAVRGRLTMTDGKLLDPHWVAELPTWLREVLFEAQEQPFRVLRREIFSVYMMGDFDKICSSVNYEAPGHPVPHDDVLTLCHHFIKLILEFDAISFEVVRRRWIGVATENGSRFGHCASHRWIVTELDNESKLREYIETEMWPIYEREPDSGSDNPDEVSGPLYVRDDT